MYTYRDSDRLKPVNTIKIQRFLAEHTERHGPPTWAALHPRNEFLAPALESEGLQVQLIGGCLANETWFGTQPLAGTYPRRTERHETAAQKAGVVSSVGCFESPFSKAQGGVSTAAGGESKGGRPRIGVADQSIRQLALEGLSTRQIADVVGVSQPTVARRLRTGS